ncbi:hypothetical protein BJY52DRAFT_1269177 [Lactarius psammicola]|nr:hypothetical protein BJY52DRAFT_1269177 [Lactarius psammicola]
MDLPSSHVLCEQRLTVPFACCSLICLLHSATGKVPNHYSAPSASCDTCAPALAFIMGRHEAQACARSKGYMVTILLERLPVDLSLSSPLPLPGDLDVLRPRVQLGGSRGYWLPCAWRYYGRWTRLYPPRYSPS